MNNTVLVGLGVIALLAFLGRKAKQYYDEIQVRFSGFLINKLDVTGDTSVTLYVDLYNPTPVDLAVNSLYGDLFVNKHYLGVLNSNTEQVVKAYSQTRLEATITVSTFTLASSLIKLLSNKPESYSLFFRGFLVVAGVKMKLEFDTNL